MCHRRRIPSLFTRCHPPQKLTKYHNVPDVFTLVILVLMVTATI